MSNTPTVLSNSSLTNSQDPKWVAEGLAYWTTRKPTTYLTAKRIATETEMFTYWAKDLGLLD
jgi:hypothetical protein